MFRRELRSSSDLADHRVAPRDVRESLEQCEQVYGLLLPADLTMVGCVELGPEVVDGLARLGWRRESRSAIAEAGVLHLEPLDLFPVSVALLGYRLQLLKHLSDVALASKRRAPHPLAGSPCPSAIGVGRILPRPTGAAPSRHLGLRHRGSSIHARFFVRYDIPFLTAQVHQGVHGVRGPTSLARQRIAGSRQV